MNITDLLNRLTTGRALVFGFVIAGLYYFLFFDKGYALQASIDQMSTQKMELQRKITDAEGKIGRAVVYKKTVLDLGGTMDKLLSVIPEKFDKENLMKIVSNEAKVAGSSLLRIAPRNTVRSADNELPKEFQEFEVDVDLNGSFAQHMIFLSNLTKVNQILTVKKLNLESNGKPVPNEPMSVKMNVTIGAYRYVKQKAKM